MKILILYYCLYLVQDHCIFFQIVALFIIISTPTAGHRPLRFPEQSVENVNSLRLLGLRAPAHVAEGSDVLLGCAFELENDSLYSVKWYKDNEEFYRYVEFEKRSNKFYVRGVQVDIARSSIDTVWLKNVTSSSSGRYLCEVQGEAPGFALVSDSREICVHYIPENEPQITGEVKSYKVGDLVDLNCTSSASRPKTQLRWWINDEVANPEYLRGPIVRSSKSRPDAFITKIGLNFQVLGKHFRRGVMKLKCDATIAPMYNNQAVVRVNSPVLMETTSEEVETTSAEEEVRWPLLDRHNHIFYDPDEDEMENIRVDAPSTFTGSGSRLHNKLSTIFISISLYFAIR